MSEPFLAEVKIVGFNFAPRGFAQCDGQILPINQNQSLYSLLGTSFGGDGRTSFALPDLRGRVPVHAGGSPGALGGSETTTMTAANLPAHDHDLRASTSPADSSNPDGATFAVNGGRRTVVPYSSSAGRTQMNPTGPTGASTPINNMQPYIAVNFCIALQGVFPSRN
jgi:microcystin-dependent protein